RKQAQERRAQPSGGSPPPGGATAGVIAPRPTAGRFSFFSLLETQWPPCELRLSRTTVPCARRRHHPPRTSPGGRGGPFFVPGGPLLPPGLKLFDIKCAWFNENEYCEFFPRKLFTAAWLTLSGNSRIDRRRAGWKRSSVTA